MRKPAFPFIPLPFLGLYRHGFQKTKQNDLRFRENAHLISGSLEKQAKKNGKKPLLTSFSIYNLARNNTFDYSKAVNELGYKTRSYEQTLRDEVVWLRSVGKINNHGLKLAS